MTFRHMKPLTNSPLPTIFVRRLIHDIRHFGQGRLLETSFDVQRTPLMINGGEASIIFAGRKGRLSEPFPRPRSTAEISSVRIQFRCFQQCLLNSSRVRLLRVAFLSNGNDRPCVSQLSIFKPADGTHARNLLPSLSKNSTLLHPLFSSISPLQRGFSPF